MVTIEDVGKLVLLIRQYQNEECTPQFGRACLKVESRSKEIIKDIEELEKPLVEYADKRIEIGEKFADKDEKEKPIKETIEGNEVYKCTKKIEEQKEALKLLEKEYKERIDFIEVERKKEALGPDDKPIVFPKVEVKYFPKVTIVAMRIFDLITKDEEG